MTTQRKVDLLCQIARGEAFTGTRAERAQLSHYRVDATDKSYCTKANMKKYVTAVDNGSTSARSFYDFCMNNSLGDRRYRGRSQKSMKEDSKHQGMGAAFLGTVPWALCLYTVTKGAISVVPCMVAAVVISLLLFRIRRQAVYLTCFGLPILITAVFSTL